MQFDFLLPVVWVGCVHLAALEAGRPVYDLVVGNAVASENDPYRVLLSAALGFTLLGEGAFLLGAVHLLYAPVLIAAVLTLAALGTLRLLARWKLPRLRLSPEEAPWILAVLFAMSFLPNALYPVLEHDDNVYHLFLPRVYLENHALVWLPSSLFANMPHFVEVLFTLPMATGDFTAAKVLCFSFTFLTLAGLSAFARQRLGRPAAGVVALLYLSGKNVQWHLGLGYVEPVIGFFLLAAALAFVSWWETKNLGFLRILAILCGIALASKYSAWYFAAATLLVAIAAVVRSEQTAGKRLRTALELPAISLAFLVPWLAKSALYTGNPVYPNLYRLLDGSSWSKIQTMHLLRSQAVAGGLNKDWVSYLSLPYNLVTRDTFFYCPSFSIALMVLFLVTIFLPSTRRPPGCHLVAMSLVGLAAWAFSFQQGRFLVAWIPTVVLAGSLGLAPLRGRPRAIFGVAAVVIAAGIYQIVAQRYAYAPHFEIVSQSHDELLRRNINYSACEFLNNEAPREGKVLALWDNRFFFLDRPFEGDSAYEAPTGLARLRAHDDPEAFARELRSAGFTHVVINVFNASKYLNNQLAFSLLDDEIYPMARLERDRALMGEFVTRDLEKLAQYGNLAVFRIRSERPSK